MSYERVSTPAFWIDYLQYLKAIGWYASTKGWYSYDDDDNIPINIHEFNPAKTRPYPSKMENSIYGNYQHYMFETGDYDSWIDDAVFPLITDKIAYTRFVGTSNFGGILGHDLHSNPPTGHTWRVRTSHFMGHQIRDGVFTENIFNEIIRGSADDKVYGGDWMFSDTLEDVNIVPNSDGYILAELSGGLLHSANEQYNDYIDGTQDTWSGAFGYNSTLKIGLILSAYDDGAGAWGEDGSVDGNVAPKLGTHVFGRKITMPTAPNMSLTQSYEFDGTKTQTTRGGSTLTNTMWHSPPDWGDIPAWGRTDTGTDSAPLLNRNFISGRRGRRTWNLKFAFMPEDKVFPKHILKSDGTNFHDMSGITDLATDTHSASDTLYGILSLTLGGAIPFIFQPDKDEDNFAIVRFDQKSLKFRQASHRTYDFSCKLEEIW